MEEILNLQTVDQYNKLFGFETLHPLVSVIDFSKATGYVENVRMNFGFYALYLKDVKCGDLRYGRHYYDYQEGTVVSIAPGQIVGIGPHNPGVKPKSVGVLFHPDLIRGTSLGARMREYSFFSYEANEALHLSEEERQIVTDCLQKIRRELSHAVDRHTKRLVAMNIELLLDYCMRFYERQFITRNEVNKDILVKFETLMNAYFEDHTAEREGLPTVKYFADKVYLSPNYFGDLIKKETGKSAQENIQLKLLAVAKDRMRNTDHSVSQIAYELGFQYPQHFSRLFKRHMGCSPQEYRLQG